MGVYLGSSKMLVSVGEYILSLQSPSEIVEAASFKGVLLITSDGERLLDSTNLYLSSEAGE